MADNTQINPGSGGDIISTDDLGSGIKVQRVKIQTGTDGTATDVSASNPVPVSDNGASITVDTGPGIFVATVQQATPSSLQTLSNAVSITKDKAYVADTNNPITQTLGGRLRVADLHTADSNLTANVNTNYAAVQTNAVLVAAPGASKRLVVVEIIYTCQQSGTMKLVGNTGTPVTVFGPHYFPDFGGLAPMHCYIPLATNVNLGITTTTTTNCTITLRVITEPV